MTKRVAGKAAPGFLLATCVLAALATPAGAHGAPPAREIDARVLLDEDGAYYGGSGLCVPESPTELPCLADSGAVDLLALDARETSLANGAPALVLRIVYQYETEATARAITLHFVSDGTATDVALRAADGITYTADGYQVSAPQDVGDGHPKAIEVVMPYTSLGASAGTVLSDIRLESSASAPGDAMPGTWFVGPQKVPATPSDDGDLPSDEAGTYTLAGPAKLVAVAAPASVTASHHGPTTGTVKLTSPLVGLSQFVTLEAVAPATVDMPGLKLDPAASRVVSLGLPSDATATNMTLVVRSDLGAYERVTVQVDRAPPATDSTGSTGPSATETGSGTTTEAPAPGPILGLVGLVAAAWGARRWAA